MCCVVVAAATAAVVVIVHTIRLLDEATMRFFAIYISNWFTPPILRSSVISSDGDDKRKNVFCLFCQLM